MSRREKVAKGFFSAWLAANVAVVPATVLAPLHAAVADIPTVQSSQAILASGTTAILPLSGQTMCSVVVPATSTLSGGVVLVPQVSSDNGTTWVTATTISGGAMTLAATTAQTAVGNIAGLGTTAFRLSVTGTVAGAGTVTYTCTPAFAANTTATVSGNIGGTVAVSGTATVSGNVGIVSGANQANVDARGNQYLTLCASGTVNCASLVLSSSGGMYGMPVYQSSAGLVYPIMATTATGGAIASGIVIPSGNATSTYITGFAFQVGANTVATNVLLVYGSGTVCNSGQVIMISPRVPAFGPSATMNYQAGGALGQIFATVPSGMNVCIASGTNASGFGGSSYLLNYTQF